MATPYDCSIGLIAESTYGTYLAPTRFYSFSDESFDWKPNRKQAAGMRVAARVARSNRRVTTTVQGEGSLEIDALSKGMGVILAGALGSSAATLVSGSTYQHNFTLGDTPASFTVQKGVVDAGGTVRAHSFLGCMVNSWSFTAPNDDIATFKFDFDVRDLDTAQSYATPSYPSSPSLYHFGQAAATYSGTVTAPTTTALATGGTAATDIRAFELNVNNNLATDRFNFGAAGKKAKPTVGLREITGKFTAEYAANTYRDDFIADTERAIVVTLTSSEALSTGTATLQVVLPAVKLDSGVPVSNDGDFVTVEHEFTVLDNLTAAQPLWIVLRTGDATI
jgi:hypothetical protein